jgi:RNA polymerase sigma-70 factor (ECF subfamily)
MAVMTDWQRIVGRHDALVWRTAYRLLGNHADAADCFQEAFVAALELSRRQRVRNWPGLLQQLSTRKALDALRDRSRRARRSGQPADWMAVPSRNPQPGQEAEAAELAAGLRQGLADLPHEQAEVFCLRYLNDLRYREIARLLGLKTSGVGVLLHRARQQLRQRLSSEKVRSDVEVSP